MATTSGQSVPFPLIGPHDIAAEQSVLGSVLVSDHALTDIADRLHADDFLRAGHQAIYRAMLALGARRQPTTMVAVHHELADNADFAELGGYSYLSQLTTELPTPIGVEYYADIVANAATFRRLIQAAQRIATLGHNGGPDVRDTLASAQAAITLVDRKAPGKGARSMAQIVTEKRQELEARARNPTKSRGTRTGLRALDRILSGNGLLPGKTYVIGGATSMGKSTLARIILRNMALDLQHTALFTLEQDEHEVVEELAYSIAGVNRRRHERDCSPLDEAEQERFDYALDMLQSFDTLHVDDAAGLSANDIKLRLARLCGQYPIKAVVVDYLHIMAPEVRRGDTREREIARMAESLRDTAKELNVALLLMSQLNRGVEGEGRSKNEYRPTMGDFRDSGTIGQVAFAVFGLYRRDYYVERGLLKPIDNKWLNAYGEVLDRRTPDATPALDRTLEIAILKQQRGEVKTARLRFDGALSQIEDFA